MSTEKPDEIDILREEILARKPNPDSISRGLERRKQRLQEAIKTKISIRIDEDILQEFKALAQGKGYQALINQALREWLVVGGLRELLREDVEQLIQHTIQTTLSSVQNPVQKRASK
ncbi:BrnA antitoxin family protein [Myxococcota bacterium]|nr:BrnA antitoxin family protein [Myxococcota bacterium]